MALGMYFTACTQDEEKVEEAVAPDAADAPGANDDTGSGGSAPAGQAVFFAFDDYTLNSEAQGALNTLADQLKKKNAAVVQVEGHCDERGSIEYNLALGERRAQSVKNYLVQLGIDPARLSTISYGEEKPSSDGHDESAWSRNRRAEFVISAQ